MLKLHFEILINIYLNSFFSRTTVACNSLFLHCCIGHFTSVNSLTTHLSQSNCEFLCVGDEILEVNGESLQGLTHQQAIQTFKVACVITIYSDYQRTDMNAGEILSSNMLDVKLFCFLR